MVGLAILVVLTGLAVPGIGSLIRTYNLRVAADEVVHAVGLARTQAASNRRAYGLVLAGLSGNAPLQMQVVQGTGTACSTIGGGLTVHTVDYGKDNTLEHPQVNIVAFAPGELSKSGAYLCFKPDGRVLRADTAQPFSPAGGSAFAAGDVFLELQRVQDGAKIGNRLQVQVGYNGTARITYGRPLSELQGAGN